MSLTRRSFLAGIGSVSVGLLFRRRLDSVLESLERDLVDEPVVPDQLPSAAEIVILPQMGFRPSRLVVAAAIAPLFVIEDIIVWRSSQFVQPTALSADLFKPDARDGLLALDAAPAGVEIRFRVRYVGKDPRGVRFQAALIGRGMDGTVAHMLPIDSGCAIVG